MVDMATAVAKRGDEICNLQPHIKQAK